MKGPCSYLHTYIYIYGVAQNPGSLTIMDCSIVGFVLGLLWIITNVQGLQARTQYCQLFSQAFTMPCPSADNAANLALHDNTVSDMVKVLGAALMYNQKVRKMHNEISAAIVWWLIGIRGFQQSRVPFWDPLP